MDLRKAPKGGWHGTYLNKLAFGINDYDYDTETESSSSNDDSSKGSNEIFTFDESYTNNTINDSDEEKRYEKHDIEKGDISFQKREGTSLVQSLRYSNIVMDSLLM